MTDVSIPQQDAARLQLAMLAGNAPDSHMLELRMPRASMPAYRQRFVPVREYARAAEFAIASADHADVYVGCAPRTRPAGCAKAIEASWTLWVDCDTAESVARLLAFTPAAAVIVRSGSGGQHGYWPLREPLPPAHAVRANRRLAHHLSADMASTDIARILRPAGTLNHKHDPPRPVLCERLEILAYTAREVVAHLSDPASDEPASRRPHPPRRTGESDPLLSLAAAEYVPALTGRALGRDGKLACPFHEDRTPSLHAFSEPERGWVCFGCGLGGSVIDFGAHLYGIEPRGAGYHEIRQRLAGDLLARLAA